MINRIQRILDNALFARHKNDMEINVTNPSYENAMAVEDLKEDTVMEAIRHTIDDLVKIKQSYPSNHMSKVSASLDVVLMDGSDFRELKKLLDGLHEIWVQEKHTERKQKESQKTP
jgi:hypothetical protein